MLSISDLKVSGNKNVPILHDVSLAVKKGECVGLTGPSGSGKTTLIRAVLGMNGAELTVVGGGISLDGNDVLTMSAKKRRALCGKTFGFIPQNPMTAFFCNAKIGRQITETFMLHSDMNKREARCLAQDVLHQINLTDVKRLMDAYPAQLSGGMLQRVAMALILGTRPSYILADEPTSALDKTNRNLLLDLLGEYEDAGILFISHDADAMKSLCSVTHVIQNGCIIESQPTQAIFETPQQTWTRAFAEAARHHEEGKAGWTELK